MTDYEYQTKRRDTSWEETLFPWSPLREDHSFSLVLDYRFRLVNRFVPGYYRDSADGEVLWFNEEPDYPYWTRVKVTDNETGDEYISG